MKIGSLGSIALAPFEDWITAPQLAMARALQARTVQPPLEMALETTHIHPTRLVGVRLGRELSALVQHAQRTSGSLDG